MIKQNRQNQGNDFLAGIKKAAFVKDNRLFLFTVLWRARDDSNVRPQPSEGDFYKNP